MKQSLLTPTEITAVRIAFDRERKRQGVTTYSELAKKLGVGHKNISQWRNGRVTPLDAILIRALLGTFPQENA